MADVVISLLVENLNSLMQREFSLVVGVKKNMDKLSITLSTVRDVLEDAETKNITEKTVKNWLRRLKFAAYDASDALDEWANEAEQVQDEEHSDAGPTNQIGSQFDQNRETISTPAEPKIYGRDGDKQNIIDILLSNLSGEDVSACPIVGIGGLGKTTLAQLVYNDDRVVKSFEVRVWVCVSDPFDVKTISKAIIESFNNTACDLENLQSIQSQVREILMGKKYLLVLDDVWNENRDQWNRLKSFLVGGAKGSSIMVTTRLETVASITETVSRYSLEALGNDDCLSLFKSRAFGVESEEHPNLVAIGEEIVQRCKGVPLAVKSLGSLLWLKTEENQWKLVRDSEIWSLEGEENDILPALRLSYNHLPPLWRQCFAYCSIFPKDSIMVKDELVCLWIANGFIKSSEKMESEEIGNEIFNELFRRSFFQKAKEYIIVGYKEKCMMHDLMHDLACSVAVDECLITKVHGVKDVPISVRYLSMTSDEEESVPHPLVTSKPPLRTLLFFGRSGSSQQWLEYSFSNLRYLRALNLTGMNIDSLLPSIGNLKHLRYLNLSSTNITSLPQSIQRLKSLQMLDLSCNRGITALPRLIENLTELRHLNISDCCLETPLPESFLNLKKLWKLDLSGNGNITTLPSSIEKLENLRELNLSLCNNITSLPESIGHLTNLHILALTQCYALRKLPKSITNMTSLRHLHGNSLILPVGIGQLTHLQTLEEVIVGMPDSDSGCSITELQGLNQLRGQLDIYGLENVRNLEEFEKANLVSKKHLTCLRLGWGLTSYVDSSQARHSKELLDGLRLPPNIQSLVISGCDYINCFPAKGIQGLKSSLTDLVFLGCNNLTSLSEWLPHLTSLKKLKISECAELIFSEEDFQHLMSLLRLEIYGMPKLTDFPKAIKHLTMLQELEIFCCENFRTLNGLQHLTNLQCLLLHCCHPDLQEKFEKDEWDEEWEYIYHIPDFQWC